MHQALLPPKHFVWINSSKSFRKPALQVLLLSPFHPEGNWGPECLNDSPTVTQQVQLDIGYRKVWLKFRDRQFAKTFTKAVSRELATPQYSSGKWSFPFYQQENWLLEFKSGPVIAGWGRVEARAQFLFGNFRHLRSEPLQHAGWCCPRLLQQARPRQCVGEPPLLALRMDAPSIFP